MTKKLSLCCYEDRRDKFINLREKENVLNNTRIEKDSLGEVKVPADRLWGAQTQRSLEHFSIGKDLIPGEMITAYAVLEKAAGTRIMTANGLMNARDQQRSCGS